MSAFGRLLLKIHRGQKCAHILCTESIEDISVHIFCAPILLNKKLGQKDGHQDK